MEIIEGPIIYPKSCINCIHSIENKTGIVCAKTDPVRRFFSCYKKIESPTTDSCPQFEAIPEFVPRQCKYCLYFDKYFNDPACYNISLRKLIFGEPDRVSPTHTCEKFIMAQKFRKRHIR